jgi:septum formation protein
LSASAGPLLLASASPARRRLLEQAGVPHRVRVSGVEEEAFAHADTSQLVQHLARAKAEAVWTALAPTETTEEPCSAVLGCDSLLTFEEEAFGKPADAEEACRRWARMAGRWAELHTGHCLIPLRQPLLHPPLQPPLQPECNDKPESADPVASGVLLTTVTTRLKFASLDAEQIRAYVATGEPLQCAGGFALEGRGGLLVERLEGCWSNVIGLSLPLLRSWLQQLG